ncbi:GrpB family protein [Blastochloris viridis]|uniref:Uncharacterized protein n=1 Tax=Blastochloris viridis TaxID=1079 RepID=A0A182D336_BLAVI|nr:GrpB family protein [Blastochloris viridis]BAR99321.1 hypothetical protein BV133_1728 [Blastochloris viridis]
MITDPDRTAADAALKRRLAADHPGNRIAYGRGKAAFIEETMRRIRSPR